ncbi:DNA translocase FtsK [Tuwongella immobilis]|uniref:FtsK domain-containing protein n=1 Tax=Tuwongella immobilis TaxID=692036 RepID=A0A6C2YIW1_9BACT|nr:DNA translocase FtsK [Tuwongella immobilis]VIP01025.1 stage iii sporulation protein e : Hypothetical conserved protein OS=uncultured planctomycete GN=HGMM_F12C05C07 PE=4 SV=1: FtsK_SpoIIIE: Ftsk_gamma [Tuwongella immobilis]VTR97475.1 stage iii sporulation protein e : Hypothetical conserved protein OS=uncultured planctomycete GN=HGMM_F12C05C07 PE=4 SV=1: FtsK_SpoIIIE: Ftsk_gamma [Tuwongella immobilis]
MAIAERLPLSSANPSAEPPVNLRLDLHGSTLFGGALLVSACLVGSLLAPSLGGHWFGAPGEWLASRILGCLGVATAAMMLAWWMLAGYRLAGMRRPVWMKQMFGWLLVITASSITADCIWPSTSTGQLGGGGTIGSALRCWLVSKVAFGGMHVAHLLLLIAGLSIVARSLMQWLLRTTVMLTIWTAMVMNRVVRILVRMLVQVVTYPVRLGRHWLPLSKPATAPTPATSTTVTPTASATATAPSATSSTTAPAMPPRPPRRPIEPKFQPMNLFPTASPEKPTEQGEITELHAEALPPTDPARIPIHHHSAPKIPTDAEATVEASRPFELPPLNMLDDAEPFPVEELDSVLRERAAVLEQSFTDFGLNIRVVGIHTGPVITQFEVALETGLRVAKVMALADDLARCLQVPSVRIVASLPGKNTVGIEVPNSRRAVVRLKELILASEVKAAKAKLPLFLGKDNEGKPLVYDLADMPHLLIAGRTGTGKSVCLNSLITSLLMTRSPDEVRMIMIDPKMLEMNEYGKIPHLMMPIVVDMKKAEAVLNWAVEKMDDRYEILARARVRNIASYNELSHDEILARVQPADDAERKRAPAKMPYIVIIIDEMAELMMMMKKEVEGHIIRLAQKSRAAGIHLVVATQRPTVDVVTGLIKSNLPSRIAFQVTSRTDSVVVLDEKGAEKLLGKGDMLFLAPGTSTLARAQGTYLSDQEITRIVEHIQVDKPNFEMELLTLKTSGEQGDPGEGASFMERVRARDPLYEQAIEIVIREQRGSTSLLQRAMGIGYGRAARLIDFMAEDGIVGNYNGSQAREVTYKPDEWEAIRTGNHP